MEVRSVEAICESIERGRSTINETGSRQAAGHRGRSPTQPLMTPYQDNRQGASWDEAELNTLRAGAALTFREKLHWLEETEKLGNRLLTCRVRYPDPNNTGAWLLAERTKEKAENKK